MRTIHSILFTLLLSIFSFLDLQGEVKLPRFICDGMVLQRNTTTHVWGTATPGETVTVTFLSKKYTATADTKGQWIVDISTLNQKRGGGPYTMDINGIHLSDIYIGDVWLCTGQSNMDLHTARLVDLYKEEFDKDSNPAIHLMQTSRTPDISGPADDVRSDGFYPWEALKPENVGHWSGISYFYAKEMFKRTGGVPQGIINCSKGGSDIVSWISSGELQKVAPKYIDDLNHLRQPGYLERCNAINKAINDEYARLLAEDPGLKEGWMAEKYDDSKWRPVNQYANMLCSDNGRPWCGTIWLRKVFYVLPEQLGLDSLLRLGCMVDADETYVNGVKVGETTYQYPPRKYTLPKGLLHEGRNFLCIRLRTNGGGGKFIEDKPYRLYFKDGSNENIEIGMWKMKPGVLMPKQPMAENADWGIASSLYDCTIYPLRHFSVAGILWYQGETNADRPDEYRQLLPVMIKDWRRDFGEVPVVIFGLANYMERHEDPNYDGGWAKLREAQRLSVKELKNSALVTLVDIGEWNDIHPLHKKEAAQRAALQMQRLYLGSNDVSEGPAFSSVSYQNGQAHVKFVPGTAVGLEIRTPQPHSASNPLLFGCGFSIAGLDGMWYWANAKVEGSELIVWNDQVPNPCAIRYAWDDDPIVTIFNKQDLPAAPFSSK